MKPLFLVPILILGLGCAQFDLTVAAGVANATKGADKALTAAIWYVCKGASVGAVKREFGAAPHTYVKFCGRKTGGLIE